MNGYNITAATIELDPLFTGFTINRGAVPGSLTAGTLSIEGGTLNLIAADSITTLLDVNDHSTVTTAATSNVTAGVSVDQGSTLNLGANLALSGNIDIENGATLNAHGFGLTSSQLTVGYLGSSAASLTNTGLVNVNDVAMGNGSALTLHGGDVINNSITLVGGSTLTVREVNGTGLTFNGASAGALSISTGTGARRWTWTFTRTTPASPGTSAGSTRRAPTG